MASTPTSRIRAPKQAIYDNPETWGIWLNAALDLFDDAFGGIEVAVGANVTLTVQNYTADQARTLFLELTGAGGFTITVPAVDKAYLIINNCAADVTITPLSGVGASVRAGTQIWWYCDGVNGHVVDTPLDKIKAPAASLSMNSQKITNVAAGADPADGVNKAQLDVVVTNAAAAAVAASQPILVDTEAAREAAQTAAGISVSAAGTAVSARDTTLAAYDAFDDRYLGAKAADPATDNDGNALIVGALYFNSVAGEMRVWGGAAWGAAYLPAAGYQQISAKNQDNGYAGLDGEGKALVANLPVGTAANNLVVLDGTGKLPAVDGSQLTNLKGGLVLIAAQTVSTPVAALDFTSGITSTYDEYELRIQNLKPATNTVNLLVRTSTNAGASFDSASGDYMHAFRGVYLSGASSADTRGGSFSDTEIETCNNPSVGSSSNGLSGVIRMFAPSATGFFTMSWELAFIDDTGRIASISGAGSRLAVADVDAVRLLFSSGNIASGYAKLYGMQKS